MIAGMERVLYCVRNLYIHLTPRVFPLLICRLIQERAYIISTSRDEHILGQHQRWTEQLQAQRWKRVSFVAHGSCLSIMHYCNLNYSYSELVMCTLWSCIGTIIIRRVMDDTLCNRVYCNVLSNW